MVIDVIEVSTNQKSVNCVFCEFFGNGKEFLDETFCVVSKFYLRVSNFNQ